MRFSKKLKDFNLYARKKLYRLTGKSAAPEICSKKMIAREIVVKKILPDFESSGYIKFVDYWMVHQNYWEDIARTLKIDFEYIAMDERMRGMFKLHARREKW